MEIIRVNKMHLKWIERNFRFYLLKVISEFPKDAVK